MSSLRYKVKQWFDANEIPVTAGFLETGMCHFINNMGTEISMEVPVNNTVIYFFSPLAPLVKASREVLMRKALIINASQAETQGACVGIHMELNALAVFYALNINVDFSEARLLNCLNNFIKISMRLADKFDEQEKWAAANPASFPFFPQVVSFGN